MAERMAAYPEPEPVRHPVMFQDWCDLTFLHWRYPAAVLAEHVPHPLTVDEFDGSAWVGVTPFVLRNLRPPLLPPLPWISQFAETNCRTYVRAPDGTSGVWFFSLDAARAPAVVGARLGYGLPYAWSRMSVTIPGARLSYRSSRRWPDESARTKIEIERGSPVEPGALEWFLTARFRLFSFVRGRLVYARVDHAPWPLFEARVIRVEQSLTASAGLPQPGDPPLAHFSSGVRVRVGAPHTLGRRRLGHSR